MIDRTITLPNQAKIFGLPSAGSYNKDKSVAQLIGRDQNLASGSSIIRCANVGAQNQSITIENIEFAGNKVVQFDNLSSVDDVGVVGIDPSHVKNGFVLKGVSFRNLAYGIKQTSASPYLDKVTLQDCHFNKLYKAIIAESSGGLNLLNVLVYDCFDWIDAGNSFLDAVGLWCNNSSFSSEDCQIRAGDIQLNGFWFEGGNNWICHKNSAVLCNGHMSEAFSQLGSTKFSVKPQDRVSHISLQGVRIPENTRLLNDQNLSDVLETSLIIQGCRGGSNFGITSDIRHYLRKGMPYFGFANQNHADWNCDQRHSPIIPGYFRDGAMPNNSLYGHFVKSRRFALNANGNLRIDVSPTLVNYGVGSENKREYLDMTLLGDDGASEIYHAKLSITKGKGNNWKVFMWGQDATKFSVNLSNMTNTGVNVSLSKNHNGLASDDLFFVDGCSENVKLVFNPTT